MYEYQEFPIITIRSSFLREISDVVIHIVIKGFVRPPLPPIQYLIFQYGKHYTRVITN